MLHYLNGQVPADGWVFGNFTMADLSIVSPFINAGYAGYEIDSERWPNMAGLVARVKEHAPVKSVLEQEAKSLGLG